MINEVPYTVLAKFLAQHAAYKAGVIEVNPLYPDGNCIACHRQVGHDTDCLAVRAHTMLYHVRFVAQFDVNNRTTSCFSVIGKRNLEAGTLFMYSVHAVVTNGSLRPHTTCSCGHSTPNNLCDHANQVGAMLLTLGKIIGVNKTTPTVDIKPAQPEPAKASLDDEPAVQMPEMPPVRDDDFVPSENFTPQRLAELQKIVGGGPTPELPFDATTGKCGKCGGVWGHDMGCGWA